MVWGVLVRLVDEVLVLRCVVVVVRLVVVVVRPVVSLPSLRWVAVVVR